MIYYIIYFLTKCVSFFCFPRKVSGAGHIPPTGGFIIACNHVSNLDPVVMGISSVRRINFVAKIELFQKQPLKYILPKLGAFPIKRGAADLGAIKEAVKRLKQGKPVLVFLEGTRRIGNTVPEAQPGIGLIAVKSGVPVIPAYIDGTQNVMPPGSRYFKRYPVRVSFGPPVIIDVKQAYSDIAQTILDRIYALESQGHKLS